MVQTPLAVSFTRGLARAGVLGAIASFASAWGRAQAILWDIFDTQPATNFGSMMRNVGDFDGDGVDDFIVGAPGYNPGNIPDGGRARVFSGSTQAALVTFTGLWPGAGLGSEMGRPSDLNGDGSLDFVFTFQEPFSTIFRLYHIEIYSGTGPLLGFFPPTVFAGLRSATGGDDYDGDGLPDLLVGEEYAAPTACGYPTGRVRALSGFTGPFVAEWYPGTCDIEYMGRAIEPLGDITGDGLPDFVVSSRGNSVFPAVLPPLPAVRLFSGLNPAPVWTMSGLSFFPANDWLTLALVGDTDGDGTQDIAVGNPSNPGPKVIVLSGTTGVILQNMAPPTPVPGALHGRSVARMGDLDGDGLDDVLAGAPTFAPWQSPTPSASNWPTVFNNQPGRVVVHSGDPGVGALLDLPEPLPPEGFGMSVAGLGDLDGDDFPDFVASEPWRAPTLPGRVVGYSGAPAGIGLFGSGCAGSGGIVPRIAAWPSQPPAGPVAVTPGSTVRINLSKALGGSVATLLLGAGNATWMGIPLPLPLGFAGMPTCALLVSPDGMLPTTILGLGSGNGRASIYLSIPPVPSLSGATVYGQWYVVDPGPGLLPGAMSRGMQVTIQ